MTNLDEMRQKMILRVLGALLSVAPIGCFHDDGNASATATIDPPESADEACEECPDLGVACECLSNIVGSPPEVEWEVLGYACVQDDVDFYKQICADNLDIEPHELTEDQFKSDQLMACGNQPPPPTGYNCSAWAPSSMVACSMGVCSMEGGDVNALLYDPRPLILCDDAKVVSLPTGYFEIEDADSSELLYKLGLRDGDIPISLNGFPLETSADAFAALSELWWEEGETSFDLYVERNSSFTTLYLNVYWVSP